jgi:hypothetical protein
MVLEAFPASSFLNQIREESSPLLSIGAIAIPSEMKRAFDELFEHGTSPFARNPQAMNFELVTRSSALVSLDSRG